MLAPTDPGRYDQCVDAQSLVEELAQNLGLGALMAALASRFPAQRLVAHWKQGEFVARTTTTHFFDPCLLLLPDARSEIRPEFRERMRGGGWQLKQQQT